MFREGGTAGPETDLSLEAVLFGREARLWGFVAGDTGTGAGSARSSLAAIGLPLSLPAALPLGRVSSGLEEEWRLVQGEEE